MRTVGRNDPCPCGSGKKYKKCCGEAGKPKFQAQQITSNVPPQAGGANRVASLFFKRDPLLPVEPEPKNPDL